MAENILMLNDIMAQTDAEEIISFILAQQTDFLRKTGSPARIAYSENVNSLLPMLLAGAGVHTCIFSENTDEIPDGFCYISCGTHRVFSYKLKRGENCDVLAGFFDSFDSDFPDYPVFTSAGLNECVFAENEKPADIFISEDNIKVSLVKKCEDGSGDTVIRVFEHSENSPEETRAFITSEALDCGFWFDIRKNEVKTFRIGKDIVRETNFIEGMIPFEQMIE